MNTELNKVEVLKAQARGYIALAKALNNPDRFLERIKSIMDQIEALEYLEQLDKTSEFELKAA